MKKAPVRAMSKGGIAEALASGCEIKKSVCSKALDVLASVATQEVKKTGKFTIPGLCMLKTKIRAARKAGTTTAFGKTIKVSARPATKIVKAYCVKALKEAGLVDASDIVDLDATKERVLSALPAGTDASVAELVLRARYGNLYALLREHIGEATYMKIVRNNVLVDIQGEDMLMQIFTSKILERETGHEAPFLEFIQRICSECVDPSTCKPRPIKPGCGGFGIRNFLTLFLSIEVSKAMLKAEDARSTGPKKKEEFAQKEVTTLTDQMNESNPVLTDITDAMTEEGEHLDLAAEKTGCKYGPSSYGQTYYSAPERCD